MYTAIHTKEKHGYVTKRNIHVYCKHVVQDVLKTEIPSVPRYYLLRCRNITGKYIYIYWHPRLPSYLFWKSQKKRKKRLVAVMFLYRLRLSQWCLYSFSEHRILAIDQISLFPIYTIGLYYHLMKTSHIYWTEDIH